MNNNQLTIIIPVKNEEHYIENTLEYLRKQDYKFIGTTRIIVADANSSDHTLEVIKKFQLDFEVVSGGLPAHGRNMAAKNANSEYLLFLDADIMLKDKSIVRLALSLALEKKLDCITAYTKSTGNFLDRLFYSISNFVISILKFFKPYGTARFLLVRRKKFEELCGFNERALIFSDVLFTKRIKPSNFGVIPRYVWTDGKRFKKMGYFRAVRFYVSAFINNLLDNTKFFYSDHDYWNMFDQPLIFHKSFNSLLSTFRNIIASLTWLKISVGQADEFFKPYPYIIKLDCSVTNQKVKIDKSILELVKSEGFNKRTPLYSQTLINFYRVFTIAIKDIIWEEQDFKQLLQRDELQFLQHLRNASAHGNSFYWGKGGVRKNTVSKLPVSWRNKQIEEKLENTPAYMDFMKPGDIFLLLSDVSNLIK